MKRQDMDIGRKIRPLCHKGNTCLLKIAFRGLCGIFIRLQGVLLHHIDMRFIDIVQGPSVCYVFQLSAFGVQE